MEIVWYIILGIFLLTAAGGKRITPRIFPLFIIAILAAAGLAISGVIIG